MMEFFLIVMMVYPVVEWGFGGFKINELIHESGKLIIWYAIFGGLYYWLT